MTISPRLAITLTFIAFGMIMGGHIGAIPALKLQAGINEFEFGALAMMAAIANITAMSLGGYVNRRFDHRTMLLFILPANLTGFTLALMAHSFWAMAASWVLFNLCGGTMDLFMNAEAGIVEHDLKKPVFSSFHAAVLYAIGGAGFISAYIADHFGVMFAPLPAIPFVAAALYAVHKAIPHRVEQHPDAPKVKVDLPVKLLVLIGAILGLDVAAELTCIQWSGQLLDQMRPDLAAYSGLGVGFYGLCSGTVRMFGDGLRARFGDMLLVAVSFAIGLAGLVVLSLHPNFAVSVVAFAITGCGLGLIFPCMFSVAAHLAPDARAAALGLASMVSGPPRILLPLLLGWLAQTRGLGSIYVAAAAGIVVAMGFTWWAAMAMRQHKGAQVAPRPNTAL
jgi:predicted MFS family arabinose efflux permease